MKVKINLEEKILDINALIEIFKKGGKKNWIKGAVNPAHKGYCTPMTKSTCTGRRRAFAMTMKKHHGFHKAEGGILEFVQSFAYGGNLQSDPKELQKGGKPMDTSPKEVKKRINIPFNKEGKKVPDRISKARKKPGGSNVGKKKFADGSKRTGPYVGPSGGAPAGSYPVPDLKHAKAAIRLSGHAPNPSGIKAAVYRKYPQLKKKS